MKAPIRIVRDGKKKIQVWHENFEYFQPNDHVCGDCSIRAVAKALNCTWRESLSKLYDVAMMIQDAPSSRESIDGVLQANGFKWVPTNPKRGERRPTVANFAKDNNKGIYVFNVSGHIVTAVDGKYYDIWDSGDKSLYGYWEKKEYGV